ncbi:hypothetical protein BP5796_08162 [Coleophoma crateriformis]|uniref:Uncharacterized protein n=1 Tax=Coleophoma crateriformis TaxID=565419 RepID=A0A3D8RDY4_9HELO|nr:hypothetical protein BP5796_08162 [Coleophoma crateriformis]
MIKEERSLVVHGTQAPMVISIGELAFSTIDEVIQYLQAIDDKQARYEAQTQVLDTLTKMHDKVDTGIAKVFDYMHDDAAYSGILSTQEFLKKDSPRGISWVNELILQGGSILAAVRRLANKYPKFRDACAYVNAAMIARLNTTGKGIKSKKSVMTSDIHSAYQRKYRGQDLELMKITAEELDRLGLRYGKEGILEPQTSLFLAMIPESPRTPEPEPETMLSTYSAVPEIDFPAGRSIHLTTAEKTAAALEFLLPRPEEDLIDQEEFEAAKDKLYTSESIEDGEPGKKRKRGPRPKPRCGCSSDVSITWKDSVSSNKATKWPQQQHLLETMMKFEHTCFAHTRLMGGTIGLNTRHLNEQALRARLQTIYDRRLDIGRLKTEVPTFEWFRRANRNAHPTDGLGVYRFVHSTVPEFEYVPKLVLQHVQMILGLPANTDVLKQFQEDGTITAPVFKWLYDYPELEEMIDLEFLMYRYHLRETPSRKHWGWCRNMYFSITQQLIRQDPVYYMLYVGLRPDKKWRLISFPYYTKNADVGDSTWFRHIDLNISKIVQNDRGVNMIQGSVSFNDETSENSTVILKGMHRHIKEWWADNCARGNDTDALVQRIDPKHYTDADKEKYGCDWVPVPCQKGEVRVSVPTLPHGANAAVGQRRTMLPWFVGIQEDLKELEVVEGGDVLELAEAHRNLMAARSSPSGLNPLFGAIPYPFPAAVEVLGICAIGDALTGHRKWTSPAVLRDRDILLGADFQQIQGYIRDSRARAVAAAIDAFQLVKKTEMECFREKSFFRNLQNVGGYKAVRDHGAKVPRPYPDYPTEPIPAEGQIFAEAPSEDVDEKSPWISLPV